MASELNFVIVGNEGVANDDVKFVAAAYQHKEATTMGNYY